MNNYEHVASHSEVSVITHSPSLRDTVKNAFGILTLWAVASAAIAVISSNWISL